MAEDVRTKAESIVPTEPGWYWARSVERPEADPSVVCVHRHAGGGLRVLMGGSLDRYAFLSGPIPPPGEGQASGRAADRDADPAWLAAEVVRLMGERDAARAEVQRLTAEVQRLTQVRDEILDESCRLRKSCRAARDEVERLTAEAASRAVRAERDLEDARADRDAARKELDDARHAAEATLLRISALRETKGTGTVARVREPIPPPSETRSDFVPMASAAWITSVEERLEKFDDANAEVHGSILDRLDRLESAPVTREEFDRLGLAHRYLVERVCRLESRAVAPGDVHQTTKGGPTR